MAESVQQKLLRVRPPRVKITYDVETDGAIEAKELPFIVGILADLSGTKPKPKDNDKKPDPRERKFVEIDRSLFDDVMKAISPGIVVEYTPLQGVPTASPSGATQTASSSGATQTASSSGTPQKASPSGAAPTKKKADLFFEKLDDFLPNNIVKNFEPLRPAFDNRRALRDLQSRLESDDDIEKLCSATLTDDPRGKNLRDCLKKTFQTSSSSTSPPANKTELTLRSFITGPGKELITDRLDKLDRERLQSFNRTLSLVVPQLEDLYRHRKETPDLVTSKVFDLEVTRLDRVIEYVLNEVLHHKDFQKLEASWRGLHYLVNKTETSETLKLKLLNISEDELRTDLAKAVEFDQSHLFRLIYEEEYGTLGGRPYSMLMGDYTFGHDENSVKLLENIAKVAAAAHAPFISSVGEKMFGLDSFEELAKLRDLAQRFEGTDFDTWGSFRKGEDSRYVTLTMPRVLLRAPYDFARDDGSASNNQTLRFSEQVHTELKKPDGQAAAEPKGDENDRSPTGPVDSKLCLWGNPAYVLTARITNAFALYKWTAAIRGVEGGGLVGDLPHYAFKSASGEMVPLCPTEVTITDRRELELSKLGFVALCYKKLSNDAVFFGAQTVNKAKQYLTDAATANAELSSRLPYMLAASRFAHYVKVLMRDKVGSFETSNEITVYLNQWLSQYVLLDDNASHESKAAYPLREARVNVTEVPGHPGRYQATLFLRPHFQLEELNASIRLVAQLPG